MRSISSRSLLPLGMLLALGCGARSPLDLEEQGYEPGSGGQLHSGGQTGKGGAGEYPPSGGMMNAGGMMSAGGMTNSGGKAGGAGGYPPSGGMMSAGGMMSSGGKAGGAGGYPPFGGSVSAGGRAGGAGGNAGGAAGYISGGAGGRAGAGGSAGFGGTTISGSRSGTGGLLYSGGTSGSGGVRASGGTSGTGGSTCPSLSSYEDLIDNLNDGDRYIPSVNGRVGSWKVTADSTPGGTMYPDQVSGFTPTKADDSCRQYAAYVKGSGFSDWGATLSFGLGSPYSAVKYTGISFWAKSDSTSGNVIRVAFPDKDTHPDGNICKTNVTGPSACYSHYGFRVTLSSAWAKYTIYFSELTQDPWGLQGKAFDPNSLYEIIFQIRENTTFSLWIDDVAFTLPPDLI
jgi:hypothetical protein